MTIIARSSKLCHVINKIKKTRLFEQNTRLVKIHLFIPIVKTPFVRPTQDCVIPRKMRLSHHGTAAMQTAAKIKEEATHRSSQKGRASLSIPPSTAPIYKEIYLRVKM